MRINFAALWANIQIALVLLMGVLVWILTSPLLPIAGLTAIFVWLFWDSAAFLIALILLVVNALWILVDLVSFLDGATAGDKPYYLFRAGCVCVFGLMFFIATHFKAGLPIVSVYPQGFYLAILIVVLLELLLASLVDN